MKIPRVIVYLEVQNFGGHFEFSSQTLTIGSPPLLYSLISRVKLQYLTAQKSHLNF